MERYRDGDAAAFEQLYARHRKPLYRYIRRQCSPPATADELFQDVWTRLIGSRDRYRPSAKFTTYLYRIAHNRLVDHYRQAERIPTPFSVQSTSASQLESQTSWEAVTSPRPGPDQALAAERSESRLRAALAQLPPEQVNAFLLHEESGLSLEEIASATGVGRETIKSRLRYALRKLREALGEERGADHVA